MPGVRARDPRSSTRPCAGRADATRAYGVRIERSERKHLVDSGASAKSEMIIKLRIEAPGVGS